MSRNIRLLSVLTALLLLFAACGDNGDSDDGNDTEPEATEDSPFPVTEETMNLTDGSEANFHEEDDVSDLEELELELDDNYFEPTVIIGRAGQELTLNLFNEGGNIHNFSVTGQNISQDLRAGGREVVEVTFPDSGAVTFFCEYHAGLGMRGELRVAS